MDITPTEKRLFREQVIREYRAQLDAKKKRSVYHNFIDSLRKVVPFNIAVGIMACILLVYLEGWRTLIYVLLWSVIWLTLISTVLTAVLKQ